MTRYILSLGHWEADGGGAGEHMLHCPVCEGEYGHVQRVATEVDPQGDENGAAPYSGTSIVEFPNGSRRPAVRIDIKGECGHDWTLLLQQHKGLLLIHARAERFP